MDDFIPVHSRKTNIQQYQIRRESCDFRERGLSAAVREAKAARWLAENRPAMDAWNAYVEQEGLPLAEFRQF